MEVPAAIGRVNNHDMIILRIILKSMASSPRARPTPITAPTTVCDVDMGRPSFEATRTVVAAPKSTEKPLVFVKLVIRLPTVFITFFPQVMHPTPIPIPPSVRSQIGTSICDPMDIPCARGIIDAIGPIAFATSFAPCAKAT